MFKKLNFYKQTGDKQKSQTLTPKIQASVNQLNAKPFALEIPTITNKNTTIVQRAIIKLEIIQKSKWKTSHIREKVDKNGKC